MSFRRISSFFRRINPSSAVTFLAIFTSFCALGVSVYQSIILRNQQYAAVWPYIEPSIFYTNHSFTLEIENKGTGPAIIKDVQLTLDGKPAGDYKQFLTDLLGNGKFYSLSITSIENSVLAVQEEVTMLNAEFPDSITIQQSDFPSRTSIKICYCSIFGDCWNYLDGDVKPVRRCD